MQVTARVFVIKVHGVPLTPLFIMPSEGDSDHALSCLTRGREEINKKDSKSKRKVYSITVGFSPTLYC